LLDFIAWTAMLMTVTGIVVGIWRVALKPRFRHKGVPSYTPYSGWMKWHHYSGLIFGLFSISWILSGMIPITTFPVPGWAEVAKRVESNGEGFIMGIPRFSQVIDDEGDGARRYWRRQTCSRSNWKVRNAVGKMQERLLEGGTPPI
jgi:hypothetical protein